ncbi:hypothetical protein DFR65_102461 [Oceanihabitans sediminis]|nr:hypothetical protein DFR65_102461 [Oceanihabitans sediminis]
MLLTIIYILICLIAINFILLKFSCNRTTKEKKDRVKSQTVRKVIRVINSKEEVSPQFSATGS